LGLEAKVEDTRRVIAGGLIVILGLTIMVCLYLYYIAVNDATTASVTSSSPANATTSTTAVTSSVDQATDTAQVLASAFLTPIVGLVGTALGFYFGGGGRSNGRTSS
jgi:hypothetical protein